MAASATAAAPQCNGVVCFGETWAAREVFEGIIGSKLCRAPSEDGMPCETCIKLCLPFPFYKCEEQGCFFVITGTDKSCAALHPAWTKQKKEAQEKKAEVAATEDGGLLALRSGLAKILNTGKAKDFEQSPASAYNMCKELVSLHAHVPAASS